VSSPPGKVTISEAAVNPFAALGPYGALGL
jgi:hypothetical protein